MCISSRVPYLGFGPGLVFVRAIDALFREKHPCLFELAGHPSILACHLDHEGKGI